MKADLPLECHPNRGKRSLSDKIRAAELEKLSTGRCQGPMFQPRPSRVDTATMVHGIRKVFASREYCLVQTIMLEIDRKSQLVVRSPGGLAVYV